MPVVDAHDASAHGIRISRRSPDRATLDTLRSLARTVDPATADAAMTRAARAGAASGRPKRRQRAGGDRAGRSGERGTGATRTGARCPDLRRRRARARRVTRFRKRRALRRRPADFPPVRAFAPTSGPNRRSTARHRARRSGSGSSNDPRRGRRNAALDPGSTGRRQM